MADRIVQMKDKNGNKCFPIAANPGAPIASDTVLGMIRVGQNLAINATDGTLRVDGTDSYSSSTEQVYSAARANLMRRFALPLVKDNNYDTQVPGNVDLNTTNYLRIGTYYCPSSATGQTITNNPCGGAFTMSVFNSIGVTYDDESTNQWCYRIRILNDLNANLWVQYVYTSGTAGVFTYGSWRKITDSGDRNITTTDPGKDSNLGANRIVYVYEA
jgi:hypothetical protein